MSALGSRHVWGVSAAQDRVWAQVSGLAPNKARKRLFMVLQAFMDESEDPDGTFVLGGYLASAEKWASFSRAWEEMLPLALRDKRGYYFKMSEMASSPERLERVQAFYRIIEKYVLMSISCRINAAEFQRAMARIYVPGVNIDWGSDMGKPYVVAFRMLMDGFHDYWSKLEHPIPEDEKVDLYFDERSEKNIIRKYWEEYMAERPPEIRRHYGHEPHFEDDRDRDFLPLQAADVGVVGAQMVH